MSFEVYREKVQITQWQDDAIYRTRSLEVGWFPEAEVKANRPRESGFMYVAATDDFANNNMTIRKVREEPSNRVPLGHEDREVGDY